MKLQVSHRDRLLSQKADGNVQLPKFVASAPQPYGSHSEPLVAFSSHKDITKIIMADVDMTDAPSGSTAPIKKSLGKSKAGAAEGGADGKKRFEVKKVRKA